MVIVKAAADQPSGMSRQISRGDTEKFQKIGPQMSQSNREKHQKISPQISQIYADKTSICR